MKQRGRRMPPLPDLRPCPRCGASAIPASNPARVYCSSWTCQFKGPKAQRVLDAAELWNTLPARGEAREPPQQPRDETAGDSRGGHAGEGEGT